MADIAVRSQVKSLFPIMADPAGQRLSPMDHFGGLVLFLRDKCNGMAFGAIETHGFNMRIMAERDFADPFYRKFNITAADLCEYN
jgi:hypothetical protein